MSLVLSSVKGKWAVMGVRKMVFFNPLKLVNRKTVSICSMIEDQCIFMS